MTRRSSLNQPTCRSFSKYFELGRSQHELDFVDINVDTDNPFFIDPFSISRRTDPWSRECHRTIKQFFERLVAKIRSGDEQGALELLGHLREPNETRFGFSVGRPKGAGIGAGQARQLYAALLGSTAVKAGFLNALEECELVVEGIGRDKISDLTTNVIRHHLATYTAAQCALHGVPIRSVAMSACYDPGANEWEAKYLPLPVVEDQPVLLIPKAIARIDLSYNHVSYYRGFVVDFLQSDAISAGSSLVRTLKSGEKVVYKKDVAARFPCSKEFIYQFSKEHPQVLSKYRRFVAKLEDEGAFATIAPGDERALANSLSLILDRIPEGRNAATDFHRLMVGLVEFLFWPELNNPVKEQEIHEGRKRIDIVMDNAARQGAFWRLHAKRQLPCMFIMIECKNYNSDPANPEIDQLAGRFSPNRGKVGLLFCRKITDLPLLISRCRDALTDDRGLMIPFGDADVREMLQLIAKNNRRAIDDVISRRVAEVML